MIEGLPKIALAFICAVVRSNIADQKNPSYEKSKIAMILKPGHINIFQKKFSRQNAGENNC